jgi:putative PEP-CTERM system TPR-repeat lipoprotein
MKLRLVGPRLALLASVSAIFLIGEVAPAMAALPPANGGSTNAAVAQLVTDARKAIKAGKLPLAVIDLKNASSADPRNAQIRAELGTVLLRTGDYYAAERELRQARKDGASDQLVLPSLFATMLARNEEKILLDEFAEPASPSNTAPEVLKARALAFLALGQSAEAVDAMEKSLKLRRDSAGLLLRARIALRSSALPAALQFTDEAIAMAPGNVDGPLFKVNLLLASNDLNGALALADQTVAKFPASIPAQVSRIEVLMRTQKNDQANKAVDTLLAKNPGISIGVYYRALLFARAGDSKNAWRIAQSLPGEFLSSQPRAALAVSQMADAAGSSETAAAILSAAIGRSPQDTQLRLRLAQMRVKQNDINGAVNALEPLGDKLDPTSVQTLAALYVRSGKASKALGILEKLTQSGKGTDATTLELVALETQMGQADQALKDLTAAVSQKPGDAVLANQLIMRLSARGRFDEALSVAKKLGNDPAQRGNSLALRAQVFLFEHKLDDALASYAEAIEADPKSQAALFGHASVLENMQRYGDAAKDMHAVLNLNPQSMVAYLKLAEFAARQNQDAQVRSVLAEAIKQSPQDPSPRVSLTRYLVARNDLPGALSAVNDLLKVHPDIPDGLTLLGSLQFSMGKKNEGIATFRRLATLTPRVAQSQVILGNALLATGDRPGANAALKNAVKLASSSPEVRLAQINMLFAEKDANGAIAAAQDYQTANPGASGDLLLGDTLARAGRRDQAMAVYKKSFAASPNSNTLSRIARFSVAGGDSKSAAESLSGWLGKNPEDTGIRAQYAIVLMQQGNNADAIRQLREVVNKDPSNVTSLNNLAWLTRDEDPSGAVALATRAAELAPNSSEVLDTLGWIKLKHGKAAESLPLLKRAHDLRPRDGEISYHLALSLDATGNHEAAKGFLKALVSSQVKFDDLAAANKLAQSWH